MRDIEIKGDNNAPITDLRGATIGSIIQPNLITREVPVKFIKNETTMKDIFKEKLIEYVIGVALGGITYGVKFVFDNKNFDIGFKLFLLFAMFTLGAFTLVMFYSATVDIFKAISLKKKGKFVEFQSKKNAIGTIMNEVGKNTSNSASNEDLDNYRSVGKVYKNIDGIIYKIKGCKCPFCESEPIGTMNFVYNKIFNGYELVCNEQSTHRLEFDYKKNI
jgi:hypothetical protein